MLSLLRRGTARLFLVAALVIVGLDAHVATAEEASFEYPGWYPSWGPRLLGAQFTLVGQSLLPFASPYSGPNSLTGKGDGVLSETYGLYLGSQVTPHFQIYADVEMARGSGIGRDGPSSRPAGHTTARGEARQDGPARRLRSQPLRQQREDAVPELVAVQRHSLGFRRRYARVHQRPHGRVHRSALGAPGRQLPDADTRERQRARLRSRAGPGRQRRADAPAHGRGDRRPPPGLRQSGSHG